MIGSHWEIGSADDLFDRRVLSRELGILLAVWPCLSLSVMLVMIIWIFVVNLSRVFLKAAQSRNAWSGDIMLRDWQWLHDGRLLWPVGGGRHRLGLARGRFPLRKLCLASISVRILLIVRVTMGSMLGTGWEGSSCEKSWSSRGA